MQDQNGQLASTALEIRVSAVVAGHSPQQLSLKIDIVFIRMEQSMSDFRLKIWLTVIFQMQVVTAAILPRPSYT